MNKADEDDGARVACVAVDDASGAKALVSETRAASAKKAEAIEIFMMMIAIDYLLCGLCRRRTTRSLIDASRGK